MKATTTLFTLSFVSAVAAGWYELDAAQTKDGPDRKPALTRVTLGGKEVAFGIDRGRVPAGEQVHLSLSTTDGKSGELRVMLQEQTGGMESRVETPPRTISSQIVDVGPTATTIGLDLAGMPKDGDRLLTAGTAQRFTIVVAADGDAEHTAALPVFSYQPQAYDLSIDEPSEDGDALTVTVHVKNLTDKALSGISVGVSTNAFSISEYPVLDTLDAGAEKTVTVHGTRADTPEGQLRLIQVYGNASYGGEAAAWAQLDHDSDAIVAKGSEPYNVVASGY
jgi:hypothetical protein